MKKFSFSLEKVLNMRTFEKKQAENELAEALQKEREIKNQIEELAQKRVESIKIAEDSRDFMLNVKNVQYLNFLEQKTQILLEELTSAQLITEEKRKILLEKIKNEKVLEKLKEKRKEQWKIEVKKEESKELDDISTSLFGRKN